jgi:hypothetical protein
MIENIHLWHADRGTYFDRHVNIISWSDQYHVHLGKYNSIGRDCNFFYMLTIEQIGLQLHLNYGVL